MVNNQKLLVISVLCLVLILLSYSYRQSKQGGLSTEKSRMEANGNNQEEISGSFYEGKLSWSKDPSASSTPTKQSSPISAKAYLVGNAETGEIYLRKEKDLVLPVASMSKLITAIESIDQFSRSGKVTIDESVLTVPDGFKLNAGEIFTVEELLYPLLLNSSNTAAEALASSSDRNKFMELMSSYAWEIGMPSTYFDDPTGLSPRNISSASDFFALARYLYKLRPDILAITKYPTYSLSTTTERGGHELQSTHPFVNDPNFIGGKTGRTPQARETMLTMMMVKNRPIAFIVLSSEDRRSDTQYLINEVKRILPN